MANEEPRKDRVVETKGETAQAFISRKYAQYQKVLDEALDAGALSIPTMSDSVQTTRDGGFTSIIKIEFIILEAKLHEFKKSKDK